MDWAWPNHQKEKEVNMERFIKLLIIGSFFILSGSFAFSAADHHTQTDTLKLDEAVENDNDTITYELIIFDLGFNSWYIRESRPADFYSQPFLERWNKILTDQWNQLLHSSRRRDCAPELYLDYDPHIDYGMPFNHELFYYFKYTHQKCGLFRNTPGRW